MRLERIHIEGFKSFRDIDVRLNNLNVLIGPNGAGKSNFIMLFRMLTHMVDPGLGLQLFVARNGGANSFLHYGSKVTSHIRLEIDFGTNQYFCKLIPSVENKLVFGEEVAYSIVSRQGATRKIGPGFGQGHFESKLVDPENPVPHVAEFFLNNLRSWKVFHFHDTSELAAVKVTGSINDNAYFRSNAANLAAFLFSVKQTNKKTYQSIKEAIQIVAPYFDDFILRPIAADPDAIRLEWREKGSDFPFLAHHLSDGTLRFICLTTALLQPDPPSVILIDEPELGLHPFALNVLAGLMRKAANRTQLIVSTQSTHLVNQFELSDLLVVNRQDGASTIERLNEEQYKDWLEDYSVGELWEKNVIGGRPS